MRLSRAKPHDKRMKALQNNISRRGLSLAPCGRGQGEGYAVKNKLKIES
jgi:hypothetical protein